MKVKYYIAISSHQNADGAILAVGRSEQEVLDNAMGLGESEEADFAILECTRLLYEDSESSPHNWHVNADGLADVLDRGEGKYAGVYASHETLAYSHIDEILRQNDNEDEEPVEIWAESWIDICEDLDINRGGGAWGTWVEHHNLGVEATQCKTRDGDNILVIRAIE
jgi:hypothetical protein